MSRQLLNDLAGRTRGAFRQWLDEFKGDPRIAWYPSAGTDFRDLMYLHPRISELYPASEPEPAPPDIFIHSDYFPWSDSNFLDSETVFSDEHTRISIGSIEELAQCELPVDRQICDFPDGSHATGRVVFFHATVKSDRLGEFSCPVVYVFVENAAFCAKKILPSNAVLSHIVHVRFGGGLGGGGKSSGIWLLNILKSVECECLVSDDHYALQTGDRRIYQLFPNLGRPDENGREDYVLTQMQKIRVVPSASWSGHGDVSWYVWKRQERKRPSTSQTAIEAL